MTNTKSCTGLYILYENLRSHILTSSASLPKDMTIIREIPTLPRKKQYKTSGHYDDFFQNVTADEWCFTKFVRYLINTHDVKDPMMVKEAWLVNLSEIGNDPLVPKSIRKFALQLMKYQIVSIKSFESILINLSRIIYI